MKAGTDSVREPWVNEGEPKGTRMQMPSYYTCEPGTDDNLTGGVALSPRCSSRLVQEDRFDLSSPAHVRVSALPGLMKHIRFFNEERT